MAEWQKIEHLTEKDMESELLFGDGNSSDSGVWTHFKVISEVAHESPEAGSRESAIRARLDELSRKKVPIG